MWALWPADGRHLERARRYICALRYPRYVPGACMGRSLSAPMIETYVWEHVKDVAL